MQTVFVILYNELYEAPLNIPVIYVLKLALIHLTMEFDT